MGALFTFWQQAGEPQTLREPAITADRKLQCVSYTPFTKSQNPNDFDKGLKLSGEQFDRDLALLSRRFSCIRTYSVTGMETLPAYVQKYGMKMMLGVWVNGDKKETQKEIAKAISIVAHYKSVIQAIVVGNETLLRREVTSQRLIGYIHQVKEAFPDMPVTYADVWEFWLEYPEVATVTDFVTIHILPYWEDIPSAINDSIEHVRLIRAKLAATFPNQTIFLGETGWPSYGRMREGALPSPVNEARFIRGVVAEAEGHGWGYNLIEAFDQPWKRNNEGGVGGYWGLYDTNRLDKKVFEGPVSNYPDWENLFYISLSLLVASLMLLFRIFPMRWKRLFLFNFIAVTGAVLWVLQLRQFWLIAHGRAEYFKDLLLLGLSLASYWLGLWVCGRGKVTEIVSFRKLSVSTGSFVGGLKFVTIFSLLMITMALIFDGRYRIFPVAGLMIPVCTFAFLSFLSSHTQKFLLDDFREEKILGWLLLLGSIFIFVNETSLNWQADLWIFLCLLSALSLLKGHGHRVVWQNLRPLLMPMIFICAVALALRYGLMEWKRVTDICVQNSPPGWCKSRSVLGYLIYLQIFGRLSLVLFFASFPIPRRSLILGALMLSIVGLVLYNVTLSAPLFVLALLRGVREKS